MIMKSKKVKGSITVFALIVLTAYVVFVSSLLDLYRYTSAGAVFRSAVTTSVKSLRQTSDTYALSRYGFGFCSLDDNGIKTKAAAFANDIIAKSCTDVKPVSIDVQTQHLVDSSNVDISALEDRIINICSETVSKSELDSVADTLDAFDSTKDTLNSRFQKVRGALENVDTTALKNTSSFDFIRKCIEPDDTDIASEQLYSCRTSSCSCAVWSAQDWAYQQPKTNSRTLLESCKNGLEYMYECVCSSEWFRSRETVFSHGAQGFENGLYSSAGYLDKYFQTQLNDQGSDKKTAENEYVLFGHRSNYDNKLYAAQRIFEIRLAYNLCSLTDDFGKSAQEDNKAALKAVNEAKLETAMILAGKSVKLIKSKSEFKTSDDTADSEILSLAQSTPTADGGVDYQAHLRYLLLHSISFEMMYARIADVVGFGIGKPLCRAVTDIKVTVRSKFNITNVSLAGMIMKGKTSTAQAEISF